MSPSNKELAAENLQQDSANSASTCGRQPQNASSVVASDGESELRDSS